MFRSGKYKRSLRGLQVRFALDLHSDAWSVWILQTQKHITFLSSWLLRKLPTFVSAELAGWGACRGSMTPTGPPIALPFCLSAEPSEGPAPPSWVVAPRHTSDDPLEPLLGDKDVRG